ncbi:hypothetical protein BQ8482_120086 [Mesorhizobium delmotii]|uniref:Uncharacterized protein n=1 Tax=Mesorhizobium delmotii TaxID=1631247 RepID=A0A2P9AFW3_9HYPH|nr:hypothetical protein BQ8482_120086 [Mesorhizobium delmotii]
MWFAICMRRTFMSSYRPRIYRPDEWWNHVDFVAIPLLCAGLPRLAMVRASPANHHWRLMLDQGSFRAMTA